MAYPQELPLTQLVVSKNYRTNFIPSEIAEIAASARALVGTPPKPRGIIQPLVVRPTKGRTHFEIVCGGKRFRAAQEAELEFVPVMVREMPDGEVLEFQLIENLQRSNPHPMQEAQGFHDLLAMGKGYTADAIAAKVGKDRSYVYKRLQFMELIKPAQAAFREDRINIAHALHICRLPADKQALAFDQCFESNWKGNKRVYDTSGRATTSAKELGQWIRDHLLFDLANAPWDKADATLVAKAGPCITCPKHTGANAALFDDLAKKGDLCLDGDCFESKREAFVKIQVKAHPELPRITLDHKHNVQGKLPAGVMAQYDGYEVVKPAEKAKCTGAEPALIAAGEKQLGVTVLICRSKDCKTHAAKYTRGGLYRDTKTPQQVSAEKRKRLDEKIKLETQRAVLAEIADPPETDVDDAVLFLGERLLERIGHDNRRELCAAFGLEGVKKPQYHGADFEKPLLDKLQATPKNGRLALLVSFAAVNAFYSQAYGGREGGNHLKRAAEITGVNIKAIGAATAKPLVAKFAQAKERAKKTARGKANATKRIDGTSSKAKAAKA